MPVGNIGPTTAANILLTPRYDGLPVAVNLTMPAAEGVLWNMTNVEDGTRFVPTAGKQAAVATVKFVTNNVVSTNVTYLILQSDMGDDNWYDVAWLRWTGNNAPDTVPAVFVLSTVAWAANAFQQTRLTGTDPGSSGSNSVGLGGRVRFVGKSTVTGTIGPSSLSGSPGQSPGILVTIKLKLLGLK